MDAEAHEIQPNPVDLNCDWEDNLDPVGNIDIWIVILAAFIIGLILG